MAADVTQPAWVAVLIPVASLVVGAGATLAVEVIRGVVGRTTDREARQAAVDERRRAFQRETILAVQDSCSDLMRTTTQGYLADTRALRSGAAKVYGESMWPARVAEDQRLAFQAISKLRVRIGDDEARQRIDEVVAGANTLGSAHEQGTADDAWRALGPLYLAMNDRLGVLLREVL